MRKAKLPKFKTEAEERAFWEANDSTEYVDWSKAKKAVFPNLKPSAKPVSLSMPKSSANRSKSKVFRAHQRVKASGR